MLFSNCIQRTKISNQKLQWCAEQTVLQQGANKLEAEVARLVQQMLMSSISESQSSIHMSIDESAGWRVDRQALQRGLWDQLLELKSMLAAILKANSKRHSQEESNRQKDAVTSNSVTAGRCVFADLLVQLLSTHADSWQQLVAAEQTLSEELRRDVSRISGKLRSDRLEEQNRKLREDLQLGECEEDCDVELVIEDWLRQVDSLDRSHRATLSLITQEHYHRCTTNFDVDPCDEFGGWPEKEHEIFSKIIRRAQEIGSRKDLMFQLNLAFAGTTLGDPEVLETHELWFRSQRAGLQRKRDLAASYRLRRDEIITQSISAISDAREAAKEQRYT